MKKRAAYGGIVFGSLLALAACQSGNKTQTADQQDQTKEEVVPPSSSGPAPQAEQPAAEQKQVAEPPQPAVQFPNPQQAPPAPATRTAAAFIPAFTFYKAKSGMAFTNADLPKRGNSVFIFFDPTCSHCQQEAGHLSNNAEWLQGVNLYFVSMNEPALMATFLETFGKNLAGKSNVEVLYDRNQDFINRFHLPKHFPANYVYGPDGRLKNHWEGEQKDITFIINEFTKK